MLKFPSRCTTSKYIVCGYWIRIRYQGLEIPELIPDSTLLTLGDMWDYHRNLQPLRYIYIENSCFINSGDYCIHAHKCSEPFQPHQDECRGRFDNDLWGKEAVVC